MKDFDYRTLALPIIVLTLTYFISSIFFKVENYSHFVSGYVLCWLSYKLYKQNK
jgi:hypothetical protein